MSEVNNLEVDLAEAKKLARDGKKIKWLGWSKDKQEKMHLEWDRTKGCFIVYSTHNNEGQNVGRFLVAPVKDMDFYNRFPSIKWTILE